jgi:hypothetical protein
MLTCSGIFRGHDGLRQSYKILERSLPDAKIECFNKLIDGESAFLESRAKNHSVEVKEVPIHSFRNGKIVFRASITKSTRSTARRTDVAQRSVTPTDG